MAPAPMPLACVPRPSSTSHSGQDRATHTGARLRTPAPRTSSSTARSRWTLTRPTTCCSSNRPLRSASVSADTAVPADVAAIVVLALDGIPEIRLGDDLGRLIGDALERTPGAVPLGEDDVLVVTQKIVSKSEGAVVDLTGVNPRPEAIEFAPEFDRDARQVEVVLREARRVVRMERGVLITETAHGFVCANGGIDASNVGPESGHVVTLLPRDPDGSARGIREKLRTRFGVDVPVIVSDSFGRPWRWGITDVAIGVSGLVPIEDLRGTPDADGRVMKSTIRASADEIASAAELALGKTAGRPAAVVRGANPLLGDGSIRDALMPREFDLFG